MNYKNIVKTFEKIIYWSGERYKIAKKYGTDQALYIAEIHTIEIIGNNPYILQRDICDMMDITKGRMSIIISNLCKKGLVEKKESTISKKEFPLILTEKGQTVYKYHGLQEKERMQKIDKVLSKCSQDELNKFNGMLEEILEILNE